MIHGKAMTAMAALPVLGADAPQMPRFDDGMAIMQELFRMVAESLADEIMDAQAEGACADGNQRNGYRELALVASVGVTNLRIPKLRRGSCFPEDLLTRYSRVDRAVVAAASEMDEGWSSRRRFAEEPIALAAGPAGTAVPAPSRDDIPEEHARRIMGVVADNPVGRRAA